MRTFKSLVRLSEISQILYEIPLIRRHNFIGKIFQSLKALSSTLSIELAKDSIFLVEAYPSSFLLDLR
jgi:hypothetical protein